jgi:hypothetical protein
MPRVLEALVMLRARPCRLCGSDVVLLPTLARAWWPFEPRSRPCELVAATDRWALRRQPLAVVPVDGYEVAAVLARHYCDEYQNAKIHVSGAVEATVTSMAAAY